MANKSSRGPQTLFQHGALASGSKLWVIPSPEDCDWTPQLDWYLNFQISRAAFHKPQKLSNHLQEIINENELNVVDATAKLEENPNLMIACERRLPAEMLIRVPTLTDHKSWIANVYKIWLQVHKPSLRVFLPINFPISQFSNFWNGDLNDVDVTLVPSQKATRN